MTKITYDEQMTYNISHDFLFYHLFSYGTDTSVMKLDDVRCSHNNYLTILQCFYSAYIDSGCTNSNSYDATVQCCELHMLNDIWQINHIK